jgi:FAD synthetase
MSLEKLVSKYIGSAEHVFGKIAVSEVCINVDVDELQEVLKHAEDYLNDAKYYRDKGQFEVSLASVAYCEGLLDALRLLGAVKFEWLARKTRRSEK